MKEIIIDMFLVKQSFIYWDCYSIFKYDGDIMLSKVYPIGEKLIVQKWNLDNKLGLGFEDFIYNTLCQDLTNYFKSGTRIFHTSSTRDDGKDIIITSPVSLHGILNHNFNLTENKELTIYVECKSSNNGKISYDKIMGNIEKIKDYSLNYFALVTNMTITPYTHYKIQESLQKKNISFILIDQYYLATYLQSTSNEIGNTIDLSVMPDVYAEYQILEGIDNGQNLYHIYIALKNFTNFENLFSLHLLTDRNWHSSGNHMSYVLEAYQTIAIKLTIKRNFSDGLNDLLFKIHFGKTESQLHITGHNIETTFEPPFIGRDHYNCLSVLTDKIMNAKRFHLHYIWGEAGIGKTRITNELYKKLYGTNLDFAFFSIKGNDNSLINKIYNFLSSKGYIKQNIQCNNLIECIENCQHEYRRAVLFIDDCHNAKEKFFKDIQAINKNSDHPVSIILCGRNDYSLGNLKFYSFINWCIENPNIEGWILKPLKIEETKSLIKSIINQAPKIVIEKICLMSQNNPLYIVQLIEYFLEANLVKVVNRNTVGITNYESFSSKLYIPKTIQDIYAERNLYLLHLKNGNACHRFLYVLCTLGGTIDLETALMFFDQNNVLDTLIKHRFIKINRDGLVTFIHESLFIFVKRTIENNEKIMSEISSIFLEDVPILLSYISSNEKGKLALWHGDFALSKECFNKTTTYIKEIDNISSYNININDYEYLIWIYKLYQKDISNLLLLKKILTYMIYISLHYYSPIKAIENCDLAVKLIYETPSLLNDTKFINTVLEQKAHSLFNAGHLNDGELIMKELQVQWLLNKDILNPTTLFDMFDRLCGVYIKYNCWELAYDYNKMSFKIANEINDKNLLAIAYLTKSKLYLYKDPNMAQDSIRFVKNTHKDGSSQRIFQSNILSELIFNILYNPKIQWNKVYDIALDNLLISIHHNFSTSVIRSYLLLALSCMYLDKVTTGYIRAKEFINRGIDACIQFGNAVHIWQFYNLWAIIESKLSSDENLVKQLFETVFTILSKQNLLYLGNLDICYGNIFAISNFGFYLQSHDFETEFYKKMSQISFKGNTSNCDYNCSNPDCGFFCYNSTETLKAEYEKARNRQLLFVNTDAACLKDEDTGYYIIIS